MTPIFAFKFAARRHFGFSDVIRLSLFCHKAEDLLCVTVGQPYDVIKLKMLAVNRRSSYPVVWNTKMSFHVFQRNTTDFRLYFRQMPISCRRGGSL